MSVGLGKVWMSGIENLYGFETFSDFSIQEKIITLTPILSIIVAVRTARALYEGWPPVTREDKHEVSLLILNAILLTLGLGLLLFLVTNLVILGKSLKDRIFSR